MNGCLLATSEWSKHYWQITLSKRLSFERLLSIKYRLPLMGRFSHPVHRRPFLMIGRSSYLRKAAEEAAKLWGGNCLLCATLKDLSMLLRVSTTVVFTSSASARKINSISSEMRPPWILVSCISSGGSYLPLLLLFRLPSEWLLLVSLLELSNCFVSSLPETYFMTTFPCDGTSGIESECYLRKAKGGPCLPISLSVISLSTWT